MRRNCECIQIVTWRFTYLFALPAAGAVIFARACVKKNSPLPGLVVGCAGVCWRGKFLLCGARYCRLGSRHECCQLSQLRPISDSCQRDE